MILSRFAATANHGRLPLALSGRAQPMPRGRRARTPAIIDSFWLDYWNNPNALPSGLPRASPRSRDFRQPSERVFERFGSNTNPSHFVLLRDSVNAVKGRIEDFKSPIDQTEFEGYVSDAVGGSELAIMEFMAPLRDVSRPLFTVWKFATHIMISKDSCGVPVPAE